MTPAGTEDHGHSKFIYVICLIAALLIWPVQRFIETHGTVADDDPDILLFVSPKLVKKMALGYDGLLADFYWLRTIQYYGDFDAADKRKFRYRNLYTLLDITTTLDPYNLDAYSAGAFFLAADDPLGAGQPDKALELMDRGISYHPSEWRLTYDKGFVYYWYLQDFKAAGETWLQAASVPGAPDWLNSLAAASMTRGGQLDVAIALWQERYLQALRDTEREAAQNHLLSFKIAQDTWGWQYLAEKYREENGGYPENLETLAAQYGLRYSLTDPLGVPYRYDPQTGGVALNDDTEVNYLSIPDIYKDTLIKAAPLISLLP